MYDCYVVIIHGINVKDPFIFVVMYMIESDTERVSLLLIGRES